ncbi:hypothetical protein D9611_001122 [Ephemerocybe angulata]|uniref:F-box domain-containing protein n=1 Tax=Ephemerocybe angulata TaxID=980116 RepID=A0A8H5CIY7_9AGAR|nr:hypothetical protein D9611_001117 [Tulosesus angulatus]KAF5342393.1 hypothetical protein D9611_001122 [Tulosesus angulatus]
MPDDKSSISPFHQWLGTNYVLSGQDLAHLDSYLTNQLSTLTALDAEIDSLTQKRKELNESIDAHKRLRSPIRRLPKELLLEIFVLCLPARHQPVLAEWKAPLLLTRVCKSWRTLVMSAPVLWSSLHVAIPRGSEPFVQFQLDRCARWATCAKSRPTTLSIWAEPSAKPSDFYPAVSDALRQLSLKARTLSLSMPIEVLSWICRPTQSSEWGVLERVTVNDSARRDFDDDPSQMVLDLPLWRAPSLREVYWRGVEANFLSLPLNLPGIEKISLWAESFEPSAAEARAILRGCPTLRSLQLSLSEMDTQPAQEFGGGPILESPLLISHITTLDIMDTYVKPSTKPTVFLHDLQLPALTTLKYSLSTFDEGDSDTEDDDEDEETRLAPMPLLEDHPFVLFIRAQRHEILIQRLMVTVDTLSHAGFMECLSLLPHLQVLEVDTGATSCTEKDPLKSIILDNEFLKALSPCQQEKPEGSTGADNAPSLNIICPKLHDLSVERCDFTLEGLENFVAARSELSVHSQGTGSPEYSSISRLDVILNEAAPDFVAQDERGGKCTLEEMFHFDGAALNLTFRQWVKRAYPEGYWSRSDYYSPMAGVTYDSDSD